MCGLFLRGAHLRGSKYSPADTVSQLWDPTVQAGIPSLSPSSSAAFSAFLLTIPGIPNLVFVPLFQELGKDVAAQGWGPARRLSTSCCLPLG